MNPRELVLKGIWIFLFSISLITNVLAAKSGKEQAPIWMIEEDFVKFGKKDAYELLESKWIERLLKFSSKKTVFPSYAFQDLENPQYVYFTPLKSFGSIDTLMQTKRSFQASLSAQEWDESSHALSSTLNFKIFSLHQFISECSYFPEEADGSFFHRPHVYYTIFSLEPGTQVDFENELQKKMVEFEQMKATICVRTWRVVFGSDVPKYLVCAYAATEEELEKQIDDFKFVGMVTKDFIRNQRKGKGIMRSDLSLQPK